MICPECGGNMVPAAYGRGMKVCETCGLQLNGLEYDRAWEKNRQKKSTGQEKKQADHQEYLDWYQGKKK